MSDKKDDSKRSPDARAEHYARMRHDWSNLIDDLIEEGRQQGAFDNLPGKGKPLKVSENPYARETELAHNLLKHNDMTPAWITHRKGLLAAIEALRDEIAREWKRHDTAYRYAQGDGQKGALRLSWGERCREWSETIGELNKEIDSFNLRRPSNNVELFKLDLARELSRAGGQRILK